ncbi:MAG: serine/threonine-protein kinase [Cystobacter sp.]
MPDSPPPSLPPPGLDDVTVIRPPSAPISLFAGRYALSRLIGRGGMGSVYQARDTLVGDTVALKQLELGRDASTDALERFRREVRLARRITHPHIARMHDLGTHEGQVFLTMEYVEGEDLRELLSRGGGARASDAARITLAVCEGLAAAHAAGVVHRDLKPANILLESGGRVVLTDFGIARAMAEERAARTQGTIGTPLYMAPEQVAGEAVDARADLYAVGLLLYEMLTGQQPFPSETPLGAAIARLTQAPPDLRQDATVPAALARLVSRCLERLPTHRPQSAGEVADVLRGWLANVAQATLCAPSFGLPRPEGVCTAATLRPATTSGLGARALALLPLRYLGPPDSAYLGEILTEALIDQLSRTRGFHVLGSGVMTRFRDTRDPRTVGSELGVDWVVDGTMQFAGRLARVSIRLLEARSGAQLWSGRFDTPPDVFEVQDRLGPRIAEELRFEGTIAAWRARAAPDALVLYRQAHQQIYREVRSASEGPAILLSRCLESSPEFAPAVALQALATVHAGFSHRGPPGPDHGRAAREAVERATHETPELVEAHLARAMLLAQDGDWRSAVTQVRLGLDIAPYHALSLQYLGSMQCEAGLVEEGLEQLRLAHSLAPALSGALADFARVSALRGQMEGYRWALSQLSLSQSHRSVVDILRVRVAAWFQDLEEIRRVRDEALVGQDTLPRLTGLYASVMLGELDAGGLVPSLDELLARHDNPRFSSMMCQYATEMSCRAGDLPRALVYFQRAASTALIDLDWIELCPAIRPLRALPGFAEGRAQVRARVEAIWNT